MKPVLGLQAVHGCQGESTSVVAIERADRERKANALHQQGWTFDAIATELGYGDRSGVRKAAERGELRWMRETDAGRRAGELKRADVLLALLWPSINRAAPDPKAMDQAIKLMSHRARIMGLFGKPVETPVTYAGAPNLGESGKAHMVNRYIELIDKMTIGVIESGYGSGIARPGDDDEDDAAAARPPTSAEVDDNDDGRDDDADNGNVLPDGCSWFEGKPVPGKWNDGKFEPATDEVNSVDSIRDHPSDPMTSEDTKSVPLSAQAFNIDT